MSKQSLRSSTFPKIICFLTICILLTITFCIFNYVDFRPSYTKSSHKYSTSNNKIGKAKNFLLQDSSEIIPEFDDSILAFQVLQQLDPYTPLNLEFKEFGKKNGTFLGIKKDKSY